MVRDEGNHVSRVLLRTTLRRFTLTAQQAAPNKYNPHFPREAPLASSKAA